MTMREKLARAVNPGAWEDGERAAAYAVVDAVLDALMAPDSSMEKAGADQLALCAKFPGGCTMTPVCCFTAMITAAKEG